MSPGCRSASQAPGLAAVGALLAVFVLSLCGAQVASADVPASYRVCATYSWQKPSIAAQRRHLRRNPRWSRGDRTNPAFILEFPFDIRILSASIGYDLNELGGLWAKARRISGGRCPYPGGPKRNMLLALRAWSIDSASINDAGDVNIVARPAAKRLQWVVFPGYSTKYGEENRVVTLSRSDTPGCAISRHDTDDGGQFERIYADGLDCATTRMFVSQLNSIPSFSGTVGDFTCARALRGYYGQQISCLAADGRSIRLHYSDLGS